MFQMKKLTILIKYNIQNKKKPKKFAGPFQLSHSLLHCAVLVASIYLQLETDADKQTCNTQMQPVVFGV